MTALAVLILCYAVIVFVAKYVRKKSLLSYIFVAALTSVQVVFVLFYLYKMKVPLP